MDTEHTNAWLLESLFGKTRRSILTLLYGHTDESYHLRKVLRLAGISPGAGQRELKRLVAAGVLIRTVADNQVRFQADPRCPIFGELRSLISKIAGVAEALRAALEPLGGSIETALICGFTDRGRVGKESDVELLVIGNVGLAEILGALGPAQETLARDINPTVLARRDFQSRLSAGDEFLTAVVQRPLVPVLGDLGQLPLDRPEREQRAAVRDRRRSGE
jgi:hypothetical protein